MPIETTTPRAALEPMLEGPIWTQPAATFVAVYDQMDLTRYSGLEAVFDALALDCTYGTVLGHLNRVAAYFAGAGKKHQALFDRLDDSKVIQPTELGHMVYHRLKRIGEYIVSAKAECARLHGISSPVVHVGASRTIGLGLIPSILSDWRGLFGRDLTLEIEIGNTKDLVEKLKLATLDFIISYGDKPANGNVTHQTGERPHEAGIAFKAFNFPTQLVLLSHPKRVLSNGKGGPDRNQGYRRRQGGKLPTIQLEDIDFADTKLIASSSWWRQPAPLTECIQRLLSQGRFERVLWFQEAIAKARMDMGLAIVNEVYANEPFVNAFELAPTREFRRWIGAYYNAERRLSAQACRVATFIGHVVKSHFQAIRNGTPFAWTNSFREAWARFDFAQHWDRLSDRQFPMAK
jgi:DNA-binding transcriptional LysR family regulator